MYSASHASIIVLTILTTYTMFRSTIVNRYNHFMLIIIWLKYRMSITCSGDSSVSAGHFILIILDKLIKIVFIICVDFNPIVFLIKRVRNPL